MGTRSETIVRQRTYTSPTEYTTDELFRFYRHFDSYPSGHGADIATAILAADKRWKGEVNNRNWCQKVIGVLFAITDSDMEVEPHDAYEHGDLEYIYVIEGDYADYGGKHGVEQLPVRMAVYETGWDVSYAKAMSKEPLFEGTAQQFFAWLDKKGKRS